MFHLLKDNRINCYSVLVDMKMVEYLNLVKKAYETSGGIEGQRGPLKTKTAITIRKRLVSDIKDGALIPPVVIGILFPEDKYQCFDKIKTVEQIISETAKADGDRISIIDGMQRTTAMQDAMNEDDSIGSNIIRVEFWVADQVNSLIYRMLVLNTGQIPWEIGRQLETVYGQILTQITHNLGDEVEIFEIADNRRRTQSGQYQSKNILELLLLFSSRKSTIQIKDEVARDFARLDAIETTSHSEFMPYFLSTMKMFIDLDSSIARLKPCGGNARLKSGKDLFSGFPAMAGFFSVVSVALFDEPGFPIKWEDADAKIRELQASIKRLTNKMNGMKQTQLKEFLQLELLEQRLQQKSGRVGDFERALFSKAFNSMFKNADRLPSFEPCWIS